MKIVKRFFSIRLVPKIACIVISLVAIIATGAVAQSLFAGLCIYWVYMSATHKKRKNQKLQEFSSQLRILTEYTHLVETTVNPIEFFESWDKFCKELDKATNMLKKIGFVDKKVINKKELFHSFETTKTLFDSHVTLMIIRSFAALETNAKENFIPQNEVKSELDILCNKFEAARHRLSADNIVIYENLKREYTEKLLSANSLPAIDSMTGLEFEEYTVRLLRRLGYDNVELTKASGDQGVDVIASKDGVKYAFQCKNYSNALGNTPIQEVTAGKQFYGCHVGVVLTNNFFTSGAKELAEKTQTMLWNREKLGQMIDLANATTEIVGSVS